MAAVAVPWLDKETLELWLRTPVIECFPKDYTGKGDNFLSDLHRLTVQTKDGDKALIIKCRMEVGNAAEVLRESEIFRKEQLMYQITLPKMTRLLAKAYPGGFEPLAPQCFYSCKNYLVMEDLSAAGYKMMDRRVGLDLKQCLMLMRALARFHAASIVLHEQEPNSMDAYGVNFFSEPSTRESWKTCLSAMIGIMIEELETWPAEEWDYYLRSLRRMQPDFLDRVNNVTRRRDSDYNALIHGDLWLNNVLYCDDVLRIIDFQFVQFTSPGIDLQLFLTTSPNMEVRLNHTDELIQEYHTELCSTLVALGCRRKLLTLEELYEEYHRKSLYGIFGLVCAASVMLSEPESGFDLNEAMKGKTPGPKIYTDHYKRAVKWAFPILRRMGAFDDE